MKFLRDFLLILALALGYSSAMRILAYFPVIARSHHQVFQALIQALAKRGHQITYISPFPLEEESLNVTEIQIRVDVFSKKYLESMKDCPFYLPRSVKNAYLFGQASILFTEFFCSSEEIKTFFALEASYDVVLHSAFLAQEHALPLIHRFNSLGVALSSIADVSWVNEISGLSDNPSSMIDFHTTTLTDRMNFFERLLATTHLMATLLINHYTLYRVQGMVEKCFKYEGWESRPSLYRLAQDQVLILTPSHHAVGYAYPRAPHVKEISGIHIRTPRPLPEILEKFIKDTNNGFIYFSMGTFAQTSSNEFARLKYTLLKVLNRRKEKVLFKWNVANSSTFGNTFISKWFPQQDLLADRRIKLFITHSGFQSITEAVHHGVPVVSIPVFSDQYKNAKMAESAGFGLILERHNVTENSVQWAVNEVLNYKKYKQEAKRRSNIFRDRPIKPLDEAVFWVEYVHKYGRVLQPASVHLSLFELHQTDIYAFLGIAIIGLILFVKITRRIRK